MAAQKTIVQRILLSPWLIVIGAGCGVLIGLHDKPLAHTIAPFGDIYLTFLKMTVVPILISAIALNMGKLMSSGASGAYLFRLLFAFLATFTISGIIGLIVAVIGEPGNVGAEDLRLLGSIVQQGGYSPDLEMALNAPPAPPKESGFLPFLLQMVPANVFQAMASGATLQVLVFSMMFGIALGSVPRETSGSMFHALESAYRALDRLVHWMMYILPLGLCAMVAVQIASAGADIILMMMGFVGVVGACYALMFVIGVLILWQRLKCPLGTILSELRQPLILSIATGNSMACVPSCITALHEGYRLNERDVGLLVPLGIGICRYGNVVYFAVATLFIAQLYQVDVSLIQMVFIVVGCILAGIATAGASGAVTLAMLGIVLGPLNMPLDGVLPLFIAVEPIMTPLRTFANVFLNCVVTALVSAAEDTPDEDDALEEIDPTAEGAPAE
ncbi:dicarboxylate/amino acid:cation symporter [Insolitispirillum peregrinum]|uniref:dicarboxylate/amino acid:cation symporter n=1 Tax=Insolitispirillum peregrinum TaxID=80876 RepID=UPI0036106CF3